MRTMQVGCIRVVVELLEDKRLVAGDDRDNSAILGESDSNRHTVRLYNSPVPGELGVTFYHELMHQIVDAYRVRTLREKDGTHNEDSIDALAIGLQEALSSLGVDITKYIKEPV